MAKSVIDGALRLRGRGLGLGDLVRRRDLHAEYGGNAQGGIAPLSRFAAIFAFTGDAGVSHGYADGFQPDGAYRYYGEGQLGDMQLRAGNRAIERHRDEGNRLFLFDMNSGERGSVLVKGEFRLERIGEDRGPDRNGKDRRRYFFDLQAVDTPTGADTGTPTNRQAIFDEGREREIRTNQRERNQKAVAAAKRIHGTACQVCGFDFGAFYGDHGAGFIEVHHLLPVAEAAKSGKRTIDAEEELRVVCSNCHRMIHRGGELITIDDLTHIVETARALSGASRQSPER